MDLIHNFLSNYGVYLSLISVLVSDIVIWVRGKRNKKAVAVSNDTVLTLLDSVSELIAVLRGVDLSNDEVDKNGSDNR